MMNELLNHYQVEAQAYERSIPWLAALQQQARAEFLKSGLPTRNDEEWKYTRVESLLEKKYRSSETEFGLDLSADYGPFEHRLTFYNGQLIGLDFIEAILPKGVTIKSLDEAFISHEHLIKPLLTQACAEDKGLMALNNACCQTGLFIHIAKGVQWEEPLLLTYYQDQDQQAVYSRLLVFLEEGAEMTLVEDYHGQEGSDYFTQARSDIRLQAQAVLTHVKLQRESRQALHVGFGKVQQDRSSHYLNHSLSLGGKMVRSDSEIYFQEPQAHCLLNGIYAPKAEQHVDHHTLIDHKVPHCESMQDYKGVINGNGHAVFNGKVLVDKGAQKTIAQQQNKNLLLDKKAEVDTKPQLEIYADDVQCSHGATVGQLDEEALFYLATRGLGPKEAKEFLIQAFVQENLQYISHSGLAEWMRTLLKQHIG